MFTSSNRYTYLQTRDQQDMCAYCVSVIYGDSESHFVHDLEVQFCLEGYDENGQEYEEEQKILHPLDVGRMISAGDVMVKTIRVHRTGDLLGVLADTTVKGTRICRYHAGRALLLDSRQAPKC